MDECGAAWLWLSGHRLVFCSLPTRASQGQRRASAGQEVDSSCRDKSVSSCVGMFTRGPAAGMTARPRDRGLFFSAGFHVGSGGCWNPARGRCAQDVRCPRCIPVCGLGLGGRQPAWWALGRASEGGGRRPASGLTLRRTGCQGSRTRQSSSLSRLAVFAANPVPPSREVGAPPVCLHGDLVPRRVPGQRDPGGAGSQSVIRCALRSPRRPTEK